MKRVTLRKARQAKELTQEQLEAKSGVSQAVISSIERGLVQDPASSTLLALAEALEIDPRALRFGVTEEAIAS